MARDRVTVGPTCVVGRGRLGRALAASLAQAGVPVRLVAGRARRAPALGDARVVLLAVPDPAIAAVAARLAPQLPRGAVLLHCAGRLGSEILRAHVDGGVAVGVLHPLVAFASRQRAGALAGSTCVIAGDRRAVVAAKRLAAALGARALVTPAHGPAYHAAAALLAGAVADASDRDARGGLRQRSRVLPVAARRRCGAARQRGATTTRLARRPLFAGPFVRGDVAAVSAHRGALAHVAPDTLRLYDAVAPAVLALAVRAGLGDAPAADLARALAQRPTPAPRAAVSARRATPRATPPRARRPRG